MNGTIYLVTNKLNGKQYVGQTIVARNRVGHGKLVRQAYKKNGYSNFTYEPICAEIVDRPTLNFIERFWISVMESQAPNGYNIENGGSSKGKVSEETKEKLRLAVTGFKHTEEAKRKISEANKNRSPETLAKISAANKGRFVSAELKARISAGNIGKKRSEETRKRMSVAFTGRVTSEETKAKLRNVRHSAETKAKIAKAMTGRVHSQETIEKIRLGNIGKMKSKTELRG
jgi:group I intron endonuclease